MNEQLPKAEQLKLLDGLKAGDLFKFGELMPAILPGRLMEWQLVERVKSELGDQERFLFRIFFEQVLLGMKVVTIRNGQELAWG